MKQGNRPGSSNRNGRVLNRATSASIRKAQTTAVNSYTVQELNSGVNTSKNAYAQDAKVNNLFGGMSKPELGTTRTSGTADTTLLKTFDSTNNSKEGVVKTSGTSFNVHKPPRGSETTKARPQTSVPGGMNMHRGGQKSDEQASRNTTGIISLSLDRNSNKPARP